VVHRSIKSMSRAGLSSVFEVDFKQNGGGTENAVGVVDTGNEIN